MGRKTAGREREERKRERGEREERKRERERERERERREREREREKKGTLLIIHAQEEKKMLHSHLSNYRPQFLLHSYW